MRRLCFLLPDVTSAHAVVDDLRSNGIRDGDIYVVANEATDLGDLPDAGKLAESDFYPQLQRGLAAGGAVGAIGGLVAMRVAGAVFGGGAVLLFALIGAGVNGLLAAIAGSAFANSRLVEFEDAIAGGQVLVMADVPRAKVKSIESIVASRHPEIEIERFEPRTSFVPHRPGEPHET